MANLSTRALKHCLSHRLNHCLKYRLNHLLKKHSVVLPLFFLLLTGVSLSVHAQVPADSTAKTDTSAAPRRSDTLAAPVKKKPKIHYDSLGRIVPDSVWKKRRDSIARYRALHPDSSAHPRYNADRMSDTGNKRSGSDTSSGQRPNAFTGPSGDSIHLSSSAAAAPPSRPPPRASNYRPEKGWMRFLATNAYFNFAGRARRIRDLNHHSASYDGLFYLLLALLFFFAIVKMFYGKYLGNLLTLFFRVSMRQQQIREQVLQFPFPSLLLNLLFFLSGGLFGSFLLREYHYGPPDAIWWLYFWATAFLVFLYLGKYILLRVAGWIFNIPRAVETYLFIVFMTNKIIGIFLLPVLVILSFSDPVIAGVAMTVAMVMVLVFYGYRIAGTFSSLRKEIKFSRIHFFLYLCAFEIAPVLLIYKVLLTYIARAF